MGRIENPLNLLVLHDFDISFDYERSRPLTELHILPALLRNVRDEHVAGWEFPGANATSIFKFSSQWITMAKDELKSIKSYMNPFMIHLWSIYFELERSPLDSMDSIIHTYSKSKSIIIRFIRF